MSFKLKGPWLSGRWKGPRLKDEGSDAHLRGREDLRVCACGLVVEHDGRNSSEQFWAEHVAGCALASDPVRVLTAADMYGAAAS